MENNMTNKEKKIKIYDIDKNYLGNGHLLNLSSIIIKVKGSKLPILKSGTKIIIEVYDVFMGVSLYYCKVGIASDKQINAIIEKFQQNIERRRSLKVKTDL